jgi:hypothetical protein
MQRHAVADGDVVADNEWRTRIVGMFLVRDVQHGEILHIAAGADADTIDVTAHNAVVPNAGLGADLDFADNYGSFGDKGGRVDGGVNALKWSDHDKNNLE